MGKTREGLRMELRQGAERMIEEVLDWWEGTEEPNFKQIEEKVLQVRQKVSEKVAEVLIQGQERVQLAKSPTCPKCGQGMEYKGQKEKTVEGLLGQVRLRRAYYYCPACQAGLFPPG